MSITPPPSLHARQPLQRIVDEVMAGGGQTAAQARGLPAATYISRQFYDFEVETIFRRDWIGIGHVSQLKNVGDYFSIDLFAEPLVAVRGPDRIRVMSRVCLHRWAPLVQGSGNARILSCPFHKWGYALDGRLLGAPFMEGTDGFEPESCRLPEIRSEIVEGLGLIFVTFSDTIGSISERLAELTQRLAHWRVDELQAVWPQSSEADFNWKIQLETGQECYHHFAAHPTTFEVNYPGRLSWCEDSRAAWAICHSPPRPDATDEELTIGLPIFPDLTPDERRVFDLYHLFPLTRLAVFSDRIRFSTLLPLGPEQIALQSIMLIRPETAADTDRVERCFTEYQRFLDAAGREDTAIDVMQQAGARSMFAKPGRLSHLEAGVWQLSEYIRRRIAANA